MAGLTSGLDDITAELGDAYDEYIAPKKIVRSTTNKIWLTLRAFGKGLYGLYQSVMALSYRFDPLYCTEDELASTMRIVGTSLIPAKTSLLTVLVKNIGEVAATLVAGVYNYVSADGIMFSFTLAENVTIAAGAGKYYDFSSVSEGAALTGAYYVSDNLDVTIVREDTATISSSFEWDTLDNTGKVGRVIETYAEARERLLGTPDRIDQLSLLRDKILELPNIHECSLIFNSTYDIITVDYYDDDDVQVSLKPQELLLLITGAPTEDMAAVVVANSPWLTHQISDEKVVYYEEDNYVNGRFPVYYGYHLFTQYQLVITYQYNSAKIFASTTETELAKLLIPLEYPDTYSKIVKVSDIFDILSDEVIIAAGLDSVSILAVTMQDDEGTAINYLSVPKTRLPQLINTTFIAVDIAE